ncbi:PREDICTED: fatty acid-binding protein, liver-like isoform X1 [Poecilia mexicana]|uniref:fatty acid-binding protein, liver-like isoform X1 n=1 Tax=Poecilia mexicana TaxID=48701 RepID=UPI00072E6AF7|nr:PREDICTED: fatty acid-binding protein, liver-like isoform X1 [Poecilia mexicana]XP_016531410.1 PREDICTED: fatty acid-binding protein, liver-like isoform X1 [Poecilia formosa]
MLRPFLSLCISWSEVLTSLQVHKLYFWMNILLDKETISAEAKSTLKTHKIKFKLNEEFDEKTPGGHQVKSKVFLRDGKLIQEQRWVGKSTTLERVIENGKLEVKCIMGEVVAIRIYEKEA